MNYQILKKLHLWGTYKKWIMHRVNVRLAGTKKENFDKKRKLLNRLDNFSVGEGAKIVGPIDVTGKLIIGKNCWVGKNFAVYGNGEESPDIFADGVCSKAEILKDGWY